MLAVVKLDQAESDESSCRELLRLMIPRMRDCKLAVADDAAKKADGANCEARLTPKPPTFTGKLVWLHWLSDRAVLHIVATHERR